MRSRHQEVRPSFFLSYSGKLGSWPRTS
jgi:hypothetical protein